MGRSVRYSSARTLDLEKRLQDSTSVIRSLALRSKDRSKAVDDPIAVRAQDLTEVTAVQGMATADMIGIGMNAAIETRVVIATAQRNEGTDEIGIEIGTVETEEIEIVIGIGIEIATYATGVIENDLRIPQIGSAANALVHQ